MDKTINITKKYDFLSKKERKSLYSNDVFKNIPLPNNPKLERDVKLKNERIHNEVYDMMENIHHLSTGDKLNFNRNKNFSKDDFKKKKQQVVNIFAHSFKKLMKINNLKSNILVENPDLDYIQVGNVKINKELTLKKYMRSTTIQATKFYSNLIKREKEKAQHGNSKLRTVKSAQNIISNTHFSNSPLPLKKGKEKVNNEEKIDLNDKQEGSAQTKHNTSVNKMNPSKSTVSFFLTGNIISNNKYNNDSNTKQQEVLQTIKSEDNLKSLNHQGRRAPENNKNHEFLAKTLKNTKSIDIVDKCYGEAKNLNSLKEEIKHYGMKRVSSEILNRKKALNEIHGKNDIEKAYTAKALLGGFYDQNNAHVPAHLGFGSGELIKKYDKLFKISDATVFKYRDIISNYCGYQYSEDKNILVELSPNMHNNGKNQLKIDTNHYKIASMTHKINFKNEKILKEIENKKKYEMIKKSVMVHKEKAKKTRNEFLVKYGKIKFN